MDIVHRYLFVGLLAFAGMGCDSALMREVAYHERVGNLAEARTAAERAVLADPANSEAHFLLGRAHLAQGAFPEAHAAFDRANARTARYADQITFLLESAYRTAMAEGATAYGSGRFADAAGRFSAATRIDTVALDAYRALGHASVQAGDRSSAITSYRTATRLAPTDFEIWNNLAELTTLGEDYDAALALSRQVLQLDPAFRPGLRRLAHVEEKLGLFDEAEAHYRQLVDGGHTQADARNFAFLLYNRQNYAEALPHLQILADHGQPDWDVLKVLCESYLAVEDFTRAIDVGILLYERRPDDRDVVSNLILAYEKVGDNEHVVLYRERLARMEGEL